MLLRRGKRTATDNPETVDGGFSSAFSDAEQAQACCWRSMVMWNTNVLVVTWCVALAYVSRWRGIRRDDNADLFFSRTWFVSPCAWWRLALL